MNLSSIIILAKRVWKPFAKLLFDDGEGLPSLPEKLLPLPLFTVQGQMVDIDESSGEITLRRRLEKDANRTLEQVRRTWIQKDLSKAISRGSTMRNARCKLFEVGNNIIKYYLKVTIIASSGPLQQASTIVFLEVRYLLINFLSSQTQNSYYKPYQPLQQQDNNKNSNNNNKITTITTPSQ